MICIIITGSLNISDFDNEGDQQMSEVELESRVKQYETLEQLLENIDRISEDCFPSKAHPKEKQAIVLPPVKVKGTMQSC